MKLARRVWPGVVVVVALLAIVPGCAPKKPDLAPAEAARVRAQALIDSGSSAFRVGDFSAAAKRYASAAVVSPDDPAAYYGLGMALAKLGRDDEARVAYARARELSRGELDEETIPHEVRYRRTKHP